MIGRTVGQYTFVGKLGEGGMGAVYRARDARLDRDVAIKVLPAGLASDPDRLARFEREAKILASLQHPNIAAIHGLEEEGSERFIVMEAVEGPTLQDAIRRKSEVGSQKSEVLAWALPIARQIAGALEAAHERGIIHRDLKPANVKVTADGLVKVLDFGLAKAIGPERGTAAAADLSDSPTVTGDATREGVILGTAAYMSPEQATAGVLDKRTDVWSFGVLLFEMLSGRPAFQAEGLTGTLAAILKDEPDWAQLPADLPEPVRALLRRCLQKDRRLRLRDIGDAWVAINEWLSDPASLTAGSPAPAGQEPRVAAVRRLRSALTWIAAAVVTGAGLGALGAWWWNQPPAGQLRMAEIGLPANHVITSSVAISPDGGDLVFVGRSDDEQRLYHRPLNRAETVPILGTEGASNPFFSPDGAWVGFFAARDLRKVPLSGGRVSTICSACVTNGQAVWQTGDVILFTNLGLVSHVAADGGTPEPLSWPGVDVATRNLNTPAALPGGDGILVRPGADGIAILVLETGELRVIAESGSSPEYAPTGHVVFSRENSLFAVPFDLQRLETTGPERRVMDGIGSNFHVSRDGTLVYPAGEPTSDNELMLVDREGHATSLSTEPRSYRDVRLSPDGTRAAVTLSLDNESQIWIYDLTRRTHEPVTFDGSSLYPVWSHDGARIAFSRDAPGSGSRMFWKVASSLSRDVDQLTTTVPRRSQRPGSISPDGSVLAFRQDDNDDPLQDSDIMVVPLDGAGRPTPFLSTPGREVSPRFSPDGHWMSYTSDVSGRQEVYVTRYPGPAPGARVSTGGGQHAVWAHDGNTLFYRSGDAVLAVPIETEPELMIGDPEVLFEGPYLMSRLRPQYDIGPGDSGFLMLTRPEDTWTGPIHVVFNWFEMLASR